MIQQVGALCGSRVGDETEKVLGAGAQSSQLNILNAMLRTGFRRIMEGH